MTGVENSQLFVFRVDQSEGILLNTVIDGNGWKWVILWIRLIFRYFRSIPSSLRTEDTKNTNQSDKQWYNGYLELDNCKKDNQKVCGNNTTESALKINPLLKWILDIIEDMEESVAFCFRLLFSILRSLAIEVLLTFCLTTESDSLISHKLFNIFNPIITEIINSFKEDIVFRPNYGLNLIFRTQWL